MHTASNAISKIVTIALVVAISSSARAESSSDMAHHEAEVRFSEGLALYRDGNIETARVKFTQAFAVLERANILWNLAVSEFYSNHTLEALGHFKQFVKLPNTDPNDVELARRDFIPKADALTGHAIVDAPPGSRILVDGKETGKSAPLSEPLDLEPGAHVISAVTAPLNGGVSTTYVADVIARKGETTTLRLANGAGVFLTSSSPYSPFSRDDADASFQQNPRAMLNAPPSKDNSSATTKWSSFPTARVLTTAAIGAGALASIGIGVGYAMAAGDENERASSLRSTLPSSNSACANPGAAYGVCAQLHDAVESRSMDTTRSVAFLAAGAALTVGAVATWFLWPTSPSGKAGAGKAGAATTVKQAWIAPSIGQASGRGTTGLVVGGRF